jgi:opacity protein-like surface antigen
MNRLLLGAASAVAAAAFAAPALADGVGPPGGTFYAFDRAFQSVITPTSIPGQGPFDTLYMFPDCASCAPVSDAAPGHPGYNGGRWRVVEAFGITSQLTNAEDVVAQATSFNDTGVRFVCPLIP